MKKIKLIVASAFLTSLFLLSGNSLYAQHCSIKDKEKCTTNKKEACGPNNTKTHKAQVILELEKSYVNLLNIINEKYPDFSKNNLTAYVTTEDEKIVLANIDKGINESKSLFKNVSLKDQAANENKAQQVQRLKQNISSLTEKVSSGK